MNHFKTYPLNRLASSISVLSLFIAIILFSCKKEEDTDDSGNCGNNNASACAGGPGTVSDVDGNVYNVVTIGNQCWMKENLRTTKYRNGNTIPGNLNDSIWKATTSGAQADYNNDSANSAVYGKLYNWYAIADTAGLCPVGWHIPSDAEWNDLAKFLDTSADTSANSFTQSTIAGGMLKATGTGIWQTPNADATNLSGFTGLPGGLRYFVGQSGNLGVAGNWWTSTEYTASYAWYRNVIHLDGGFVRFNHNKNYGLSVRCVRD